MQVIPNIFTSYELTDAEQLQGTILNSANKLVLQNMLATIAQQKVGLKFEVAQSFIQEEAYLTGQIELLRNILEASDAAQAALLESAQAASN